MAESPIPTIVLGGTGYVAGELLRLALGHPGLNVRAVVSNSRCGDSLIAAFPHLGQRASQLHFCDLDTAKGLIADSAIVLTALPHGTTAAALDRLIPTMSDTLTVVDVSTDFRSPNESRFSPQFDFAVPDLGEPSVRPWFAHPGCFTTAFALAALTLTSLDLVEGAIVANGITGSTGSGREPKVGTHHPDRHGGLWAYQPLVHRHIPEMERLIGGKSQVLFTPHSGPFARGIHMTMTVRLKDALSTDDLKDRHRNFWKDSPFIRVTDHSPSIKEVQGSNRAHLSVVAHGDHVVVTCVIDNLIKGAAGGAIQWLNQKRGWPIETGLDQDALGWA